MIGLSLASTAHMRPIETRLRKVFAIAIAGGWLSLVGLLTFAIPAFNRYRGRVVAISETAQVVVLRLGLPRSVRLAEIDFPEKGHPHAREARAFANRLALGRDVTVEETRLADGSRVGYVTLPDGRSLSAELVKAGLAWPSSQRVGRQAPSLVVLQTRAMEHRRGLWAEPPGAVPPVRVAHRHAPSGAFDVLPPVSDSDADQNSGVAEDDESTHTEAASLGEN
jgi:endonuclease YncB( thermonuclease family)